ncbi:hypothetical protein JTE90_027415, partial [Oedothorax gibbosus]
LCSNQEVYSTAKRIYIPLKLAFQVAHQIKSSRVPSKSSITEDHFAPVTSLDDGCRSEVTTEMLDENKFFLDGSMVLLVSFNLNRKIFGKEYKMSFIIETYLKQRKNKHCSKENKKIRAEVQKIILKAVKIVQDAKDANDNAFLIKSEATRLISKSLDQQPETTKNISTDYESIARISSFSDNASVDEQLFCHELVGNDHQYPSISKSAMDIFESKNGINVHKTPECRVLPLRSPSPDSELSLKFFSQVSNRLLTDFQSCKNPFFQKDCEKRNKKKLFDTNESGTTPSEVNPSSMNRVIGNIGYSQYTISDLVGPSSKPAEQGDTKNLYYDEEVGIERSEINLAIAEADVYECTTPGYKMYNHSMLATETISGEDGNINVKPRSFRRLTKKNCTVDERL